MKRLAIVGIHTGIGKTIASAVIAEALQADYWKPVQAGALDDSDTMLVEKLISNNKSKIHPEALRLTEPMSPHAAAKIDKVIIDHTAFKFPETKNTLLIETAGGILSPMSDSATMADFVKYYELPAILITNNYLGSINHTLLSIEVLKNRGIPIAGIIVSGEDYSSSETFIEQYSQIPIIARIPFMTMLDKGSIKKCADEIKQSLLQRLNYAGY